MKKMELYQTIESLKEIRRFATMKTMSLQTYNMQPRLDIDNDTLTAIVESSTKLWREIWVITPLDEVIEKLEKECNK
jgi:hypothetical protein